MKTSKNAFLAFVSFTLTLLPLLLCGPLVQAAGLASGSVSEANDDEIAYEEIVKDLSSDVSKEQRRAAAVENSSRASARRSGPQQSLDDVMIHGGVGFTQMFSTVNYGGDRTHVAQRGIQATLGIDLFSDNWLAEGSARNFSSYDYGSTNVALKEFDLKVVYHSKFAPKLGMKFGGGIAARYLEVANSSGSNTFTTPASVFTGGIELLAARNLTLSGEVSARTALISETVDKNSYDMTVRIDANF